MRLELLASALAFGASSIYWLIAAQRLDATQYGETMQLQALLLLATGLLSCRTYDLFYYLQREFSWDQRRSFRFALGIEAGLFALSLVLGATLVALLGGKLAGDDAGLSWRWVLLTAFLCSSTIFQGSSQAYLRALHLDRVVARCDLYSCLAYLLAGAALLAPAASDALLGWLAALAVRPVALALGAWSAWRRTPAPAVAPPPLEKSARRAIGRFLAVGQMTNLVKNNSIAIETLLLGRLAGSEVVALYRVARSLLNFSTVFLNITYQKSFRELVAAKSGEVRAALLKKINRQSLGLWFLALPAVFAAAAVFLLLKPDPVYHGLPWALALMSVALLPTAFQQSEFAALSVAGRFSRINLSYGLSLGVLAAGSLLTARFLSLEVFLGWLLVANLVRYFTLRAAPSLSA